MDSTGSDREADLNDLEEALAQLRPSSVALDRDRLIFEAGRAAGRAERRGWVGPATAAAFALVAIGLGGLWVRERVQRRGLEETIAGLDARALSPPRVQPATAVEAPSAQPGPNSYLVLTRHLTSGGMEARPIERTGVPSARSSDKPAEPPATLRLRAIGGLLEL